MAPAIHIQLDSHPKTISFGRDHSFPWLFYYSSVFRITVSVFECSLDLRNRTRYSAGGKKTRRRETPESESHLQGMESQNYRKRCKIFAMCKESIQYKRLWSMKRNPVHNEAFQHNKIKSFYLKKKNNTTTCSIQ